LIDQKKYSGAGFQPVSSDLMIKERNLPHWQRGGATYFLTFNTKGLKLDREDRQIVMDACRFWQSKKISLHVLVVMPDHVHMLVTPLVKEQKDGENYWYPLGEIVHSIKRHSSREINKRHDRSGALWWDEYYDRLVRDEDEYLREFKYIRENPVKEGLAESAEGYEFYWQEKDFEKDTG
jgi:putative transposase